MAALSLCLVACAATPPPPVVVESIPPQTCDVRVDANGYIPGLTAAKVVPAHSTPSNHRCYHPEELVALARAIACSEGYRYVGVVNIQQAAAPPPFDCHSAQLEFYATAAGATVSDTPIVRFAHLPPTGVQVMLWAGAASVLGGPQDDSGLINANGDEAKTEKAGFGVALRYYPLSFLGAELETGGLFGKAGAPKTPDMNFTREWISNLGVSVIPWQQMTLAGRFQVFASAGLSYTRLVLSDDYKKFVREHTADVVFDDRSATGLGWYSRLGFRAILTPRLVMEVGGRYAQSWPKFPDAAQSFWGRQLGADAAIGYHFGLP